MSLSNKAKQQILRQQMHAKFPYLIEVTYEQYGTFRYCNADDDIIFEGDTYTAATFSIQPPEKGGNKIGDAMLSFSAIYNNREWVKKIRGTDERGKIRVVASIVYTAGNVIDGIEPIYDTEFSITDTSWNEAEISITMKFDEGMDIVMPCDVIDEVTCPGVA